MFRLREWKRVCVRGRRREYQGNALPHCEGKKANFTPLRRRKLVKPMGKKSGRKRNLPTFTFGNRKETKESLPRARGNVID